MDTRLRRKIAVFTTLVLAGGLAALGILRWRHGRDAVYQQELLRQTVIVNIGVYPTLQAEQKASLQRLALELDEHPQANAVRILAGKSLWRQRGVMGFIRASKPSQIHTVFWYDDRFSSPDISIAPGKVQGIHAMQLISEEPIHLVAHGSSKADDVLKCDVRLRKHMGQAGY